MDKKRLDLATLIGHAGDEIRKAHAIAIAENDAVMEFVDCEIQVGFDVELAMDGKVKFWVIEAGASGTQTVSNTITLKYKALPTKNGNPFYGE